MEAFTTNTTTTRCRPLTALQLPSRPCSCRHCCCRWPKSSPPRRRPGLLLPAAQPLPSPQGTNFNFLGMCCAGRSTGANAMTRAAGGPGCVLLGGPCNHVSVTSMQCLCTPARPGAPQEPPAAQSLHMITETTASTRMPGLRWCIRPTPTAISGGWTAG